MHGVCGIRIDIVTGELDHKGRYRSCLVESVAQRISVMAKQRGLRENFAFVGGVAKNAGIKAALEKELGITLFMPFEPQIMGALGGSLYR